MKLETIIKRAPVWYEMSAQVGGPAVYLEGPPGVGKTAILSQLPDRLTALHPNKSFGLVVLNGACLSLTTVGGYLWPSEREGVRYSEFTRPHWWVTSEGKALEEYDGGVLIIDEYDKVQPEEKKILGEAAYSKILASHKLPPGWVVWFAGNRSSDKSGSTKDLAHLANRRMKIEAEADPISLTKFMERNGALPETIQFMNNNTSIVFAGTVPADFSPYCTPRSLTQFDEYLRLLMKVEGHKTIPTTPDVIEEGNGIMGVAATAQFIVSVREGLELPSYEDIINDPAGVELPKRPDIQMMAAYKVASRVNRDDSEAALKFITRLAKEFHVNFVRMAFNQDRSLINHKPFRDWCAKNSSLTALIAKLQD